MLPKNQRVPIELFEKLKLNSKAVKNSLFLLRYVPCSGKSRFSFSVSKKIAKNAVDRNRVRRQGYRIITKIIKNIEPGWLVSFSYKSIPKSMEELEVQVYSILSDAKLIKKI